MKDLIKQKDSTPMNRKESMLRYKLDRQERISERRPVEDGSFDEKAIIERLWRK